MNTIYLPDEQYLMISWSELEAAMRVMASPNKRDQIEDMLSALQTLYRMEGPEKAIFTLVAATAYLTSDR